MAPLGMATDRVVLLVMQQIDQSSDTWTFVITSQEQGRVNPEPGKAVTHALGKVSTTPSSLNDFERYERLVGFERTQILNADSDAEAMQGSMIYKVFSKVVTYADYYKGVRSVHAKGHEVTAAVVLPELQQSFLGNTSTKPLAVDNFIQAVGLQLNSLNFCKETDVYVCTKIDRLQVSSLFMKDSPEPTSWAVYSSFISGKSKDVVSDIFVFDRMTPNLVLIVLGTHFTKVLKKSLANVLSKSNMMGDLSRISSGPDGQHQFSPAHPVTALKSGNGMKSATSADTRDSGEKTLTLLDQLGTTKDDSRRHGTTVLAIDIFDAKGSHAAFQDSPKASQDIGTELRELLQKITDVPIEELKDELSFEDVGIDSLMVIEVLSEIRKHFNLEIPMSDFQTSTSIKLLSDYLWSKGPDVNAPDVAEATRLDVSSENASDSGAENDMAPSSSASSISGEGLSEKK